MEGWLYVVLLGVGCILIAWFKPSVKESAQRENVESILEQFLADVDDHQSQWVRRLEELEDQYKAEINQLGQRILALEEAAAAVAHSVTVHSSTTPLTETIQQSYVEDVPLSSDNHLQMRFKEVFDWAVQGKSTAFIAQKTGIPHGEIELILQLGKQGDIDES